MARWGETLIPFASRFVFVEHVSGSVDAEPLVASLQPAGAHDRRMNAFALVAA